MARLDRMIEAEHEEKPKGRGGLRKWRKPTLAQSFLLIFLLGIAVFAAGTIMQSFTSFEARVSGRIQLQDITSIEITRSVQTSADEVVVTVTEPAEIAGIMGAFADVRLLSSSASHEFNRSYWMNIFVNTDLRFLIRLDDRKYISIKDGDRNDKYSSGSFKIINRYDMESIDSLFP